MHEKKVINAISLFTGTAMLDEGTKRAFANIGYNLRTVLYCEKDAYCQSILQARIKDGVVRDAPIWPNVSDLPATRYRGIVGAVIAGFPCQPFSFAGKRGGREDDRYLFGDVVRVAVDSDASIIVLENVPGILAPTTVAGELAGEDVAGTSDKLVCPAPIGDVLRLLAESGFDARWTDLGAEDVSAPHRRKRFWGIAWKRKLAHAKRHGLARPARG